MRNFIQEILKGLSLLAILLALAAAKEAKFQTHPDPQMSLLQAGR